ncbi:hypothetical protein [Aureimonas sp. Leaf324]|jgi:hypothetical protein|uniref:hypothetical protein n=1 Tax=Aureimonas sp. Leaf324 TaxID=1736336 RepID=UPI0006FBC092|nr:hypothetical protein [Aureimonas sp. Leaf324]KQQ79742.1 hypothetical protein ASF65_11955 [Aureimonas sp. Leaf324]
MTPSVRPALVAALLAFAALPAHAQDAGAPQPPVPSVTSGSETQDSGVGDLETAEWIGKPVMSSDRKPVGTLREVRTASDTADAGILVVEREGGATVEVPMQGAAFDGTSVVVTPLADAIAAN